jgi:SAM-dependent methyltransferase
MKTRHHCKSSSEQIFSALQDWYSSSVGDFLLCDIKSCLDSLLPKLFGYYALQVGYPNHRMDMLAASRVKCRFYLDVTPGPIDLLATADDLPIKEDSLDLILLLHTLDFAQDPHKILREIDRTLIPEGHLVVVGFNPVSWYGFWKVFSGQRNRVPWCGQFYTAARLRDWLSVLGFDVLRNHCLGYRPPIQYSGLQRYLAFTDRVGPRVFPYMGGVNVMLAQKKVATLTPIRPRWLSSRGFMAGNLTEPSTREVVRDQAC